MENSASTFVVFLVLLSAVRGQDEFSANDYDVYIGERATPFIAYAPPAVDTATMEPRQLHRLDVPRALCGVTVLKPDLLVTSLRCSPSAAAKSTIYMLAKQAAGNIILQFPDATVIRDAVSSIEFKPQFTPEGKQEVYTNVALLKLNKPLFKPAP